MLMMLKRGLADADDAWAWGWLKLTMLRQEPADDVCALMLLMLRPDNRLMLLMLGSDNQLMLMQTRPGRC